MENKYKARSIAIHPDEDLIIVGFYDGGCTALSLSKVLNNYLGFEDKKNKKLVSGQGMD
jgi:hypothetical protein